MSVLSCYHNVTSDLFSLFQVLLFVFISAENLAEVIKEAVSEWELPTKNGLPTVVTDNAANVVKSVKLLGADHIPCLAHTVNIAVQKALKLPDVKDVLDKVRKIVGFFHRSTSAAALLKRNSSVLGLPEHKLKIDVVTRWNSAYDMAERFVEMQGAIFMTLGSLKEKDLILSADDMAIIGCLVDFLKPMKEITTLLCSENSPTASVIMPLRNQLLHKILIENDNDNQLVRQMKETMKTDFQNRYSQIEDYLNTISALDPRFKSLPFATEEERSTVFERVQQKAAAICKQSTCVVKQETGTCIENSQSDNAAPDLPRLPEETAEKVSSGVSNCEKSDLVVLKTEKNKSVLEGLLGDVYITQVDPPVSAESRIKTEVEAYMKVPPIELNQNCLLWWKVVGEKNFPVLSRLAKCLLCIPATSVPSERVFSTAGDIVTQRRAALKGKHVDMLIFLKKNTVD